MAREMISAKIDVIKDMSEDTRIREMARHREKMLHDEASLMRGEREKGREEERKKWMVNLAKFGMSEEDIIKVMSMKQGGE